MLSPRIDDIQFINIGTNNIAYLDDFKMNAEFKVLVTGKNLGNLLLTPGYPLSNQFTVVRTITAPERARQKEFVVKFNSTGAKKFRAAYFSVRQNNKNKKMLDFQKEFHKDKIPTCQIYDKPIISVLSHTITGIYDRPRDKEHCDSLNTFSGSYTIAEDRYCLNNVKNPTLEAPLQEKEVTLAPIAFKLVNGSYAPIFTPFKIKIKNGINVIKEITVNRLIAKEEKTITFTRDQQKKIFARHRDCPKCYEKNVAPFNCLNIPLTIVVDEENVTGGGSSLETQIRGTLNP